MLQRDKVGQCFSTEGPWAPAAPEVWVRRPLRGWILLSGHNVFVLVLLPLLVGKLLFCNKIMRWRSKYFLHLFKSYLEMWNFSCYRELCLRALLLENFAEGWRWNSATLEGVLGTTSKAEKHCNRLWVSRSSKLFSKFMHYDCFFPFRISSVELTTFVHDGVVL